MPSVLQAPLNLSVGFMLKEKAPEPILSAFTAVNGRASPPSPPTSNSTNGMTTDSFHVRPLSRNTAEPSQEHQDSLPRRDGWRGVGLPPLGPHGLPLTNGQMNGHPNGHYSPSSSPVENGSPNSPGKRKRSSSAEGTVSPHSQDGAVRRRLDSYASIVTNGSPVSQGQPNSMDHSQQQALPPKERAEHERTWQPRELQDGGHGNYLDQQPRNARKGDVPQEPMPSNSATLSQPMGAGDSQIPIERSSTLEITKAGVLVDPKKRKRQFANRTKTGCGTCRRRKKKCDEAKPECNNCLRGSFICEGYANKVPWPKNNANKHQPLQSKDQFPINPPQLYHNHGTNREGYPPDPNGHTSVDGAPARPIVVDEHDRQPAAAGRNGWGNWAEPPRASYAVDHHRPTEFSHPPSIQQQPPQQPPPPPPPQQQQQPLARPPSNDHHAPHPTQGPPPPQRQHNPRIYHHTQQTMGQNVKSSPVATAEAALQHQSQQQPQPPPQQPQMHPAQPHTTGPPAPPPPHYQHPPPPKPEKTEKDKMLSGEPFQPYNHQLCEDRERARQLCYRYNQTTNQHVEIGREEVGRICRAIFGTNNYRTNPRNPNQMQGYLGRDVQVDTPFYCDYGYNIFINDRVAIEANCKFLDSGKITIGQNCTIEANVTISTKKVPNDIKAMKGTRGSAIAADVVIGDNVWIGANSTIHAGVKIGTGAIIYPGSVVTRDIPRDVAVRGNPAEIHMVGWDEH